MDDTTPSNIPLDNAKEVVRMSEAYIDAILQISISADSRAMQLSSVIAATSTGLLVFGLGSSSEKIAGDVFATASFTASGLFFLALLFSLLAASPRAMGVSGTIINNWSMDELTGDLTEPLVSQAKIYAKHANENMEILKQNANRIRIALIILGATPLISAIAASLRYIYLTQ